MCLCGVYKLKSRVEVARNEIKERGRGFGVEGDLSSGDGNLCSARSNTGCSQLGSSVSVWGN